MKIGFVGGTGPEGLGLAMRFAKAGEEVLIGSRSKERAEEAAKKIKEKLPQARVKGYLNEEAVRRSDIIFVTVPYNGHREILEALQEQIGSKVVVDVVVPVEFGKDGVRALPVEEGSAAQQAAAILPQARVVSGFHHLDASDLQRTERPMQGDVIICSNDRKAKKTVMELAERIQYVRALDGGLLANSRYLEAWTAMLLNINRIYKVHTGVRVVGV